MFYCVYDPHIPYPVICSDVVAGDRFGPGMTGHHDASFPIQDVLENYIYYFQSVHESIEPTHDIFSFYISDGNSHSEIHSINITIEVKTLYVGKVEPLTTILPHYIGMYVFFAEKFKRKNDYI